MVSEITMNPTEKYISDICRFLGFKEDDFTQKLKELRDKGWIRWGGGTVEITVAEILYVITRLRDPNHVFEGGTSWGYSTAHIAQAIKDNGKVPDNILASVDIDADAHRNAETYLWEKDIELSLDLCDSVAWLSEGILHNIPNLDMVFIDTSHTYEHTVKEWAAMLPLLDEKSIILFHDAYTEVYGVKKFLSELPKEWKVLTLDTQSNTGLGIVVKNV